MSSKSDFNAELRRSGFNGEIFTNQVYKALYATDASIYKEYPTAVVYPKDEKDVQILIKTCQQFDLSVIPRAAGTSLAGQCVGSGVVADISRHMTNIIHFDSLNGRIRLQPGIIRDSLNDFLKPYGWFFGPNTSTSNRCMIGGMIANNSSGSTSIKYGTSRDKVIALRGVLASGEIIELSEGNTPEFLINFFQKLFTDTELITEIEKRYPKKSIHRRNTGYALDVILDQWKSDSERKKLNLAKLISGSEGTLMFITEITLQLDRLPPKKSAVICAHFSTIRKSLEAARVVMKLSPYACELVDKIILDCTKENLEQRENRFFIMGDPEAILAVELRADTSDELNQLVEQTVKSLKKSDLGYAFPVLYDENTQKIWSLRAAGLGLLSNIPGKAKALACIEDTAVDVEDLPQYIDEFDRMMEKFGQRSVHYAHAGAGEIHLRPILDLRDPKDFRLLREICKASADLVSKYNGSLSGEHGDGRVRAEFIRDFYGEKIYKAILDIKKVFDPHNVLNPGKIVVAPPMDTSLRQDPSTPLKNINTYFDYSKEGGFLAAVEKCNGSADCRKPFSSGGVMCPSYQATLNEIDTTRARANSLREFVSGAIDGQSGFAHPQLKEVMDLCLACKGCKRECPSNVDMATMKSEWLYQYQKKYGISAETLFFGNFENLARLASVFPKFSNAVLGNNFFGRRIKRFIGISEKRKLPAFSANPLRKRITVLSSLNPNNTGKSVYFFIDEFINYYEPTIGENAVKLLQWCGYEVKFCKHPGSGRSFISKGLLPSARKVAEQNIKIFHNLISKDIPLVGLEPSAILTFRDEYPRLVRGRLKEQAHSLSEKVFLIDEFLAKEIKAGKVLKQISSEKTQTIHLHGHCHQKALSTMRYTREILEYFGFNVKIIPAGCCGMAGSFGYEKDHYELSIKIGEMALFPYIRNLSPDSVVIATGISCRHQILEGTRKNARHWVDVLLSTLTTT